MNGMNNQAMLGAGQPFRAELTERQESSGGGSVAKTFVKIILTLVVIGVALVSLPFVFCGLWLVAASVGPAEAVGPVLGIAGVIVVFALAIYSIIKIFKKK